MSAKSYYGNANYGVIDSNRAELTGLDIPMPQTALKLGFPPTSGYFFTTMRDEALDTLDKLIIITKKGHLKLTFKTSIFTNGGDIDIQIMKLDASGLIARRRFSSDGYIEVNFDIEVEVNDRFAIYVQANVGGAFFKFIPAEGDFLVEQSAYILNLELTEPLDDIGSLVWSIDPNLESFGSCIKLDRARTLLKADFPLLYAKLFGSPYIESETDLDFILVDFTLHPYLRTGSSLNVLWQNLPDPQIDSTFTGDDTDYVNTGGSLGFGGNSYSGPAGEFTLCFDESQTTTDSNTWGGEALAGSNFPTTSVFLRLNDHSHSITGTVSPTVNNSNYTNDQNIKLKTVQMFLYMICDNQL